MDQSSFAMSSEVPAHVELIRRIQTSKKMADQFYGSVRFRKAMFGEDQDCREAAASPDSVFYGYVPIKDNH